MVIILKILKTPTTVGLSRRLMIGPTSLLATATMVFMSAPAIAFNPEEHKVLGDLGSEKAADAVRKVVGTSRLIKFRHRRGEVRLVVKGRIPNDDRFKGSYVPKRGSPQEARSPVLIWVGKADRSRGEWFTFGDLVSLYGDFRRIITCDARPKNSDCRLTDPPRPRTRGYNANRFLKARYAAMKDLAQGWNFWDDSFFSCQVSSVAVTNRGVIEGRNHQGAWCDEFYKIAKGNHWHFGPTALKWYVAMHRQAFLLMSKAAKARNQRDRQIYIWKALHYEGHALHSLTDLFAPGHIMVDRYATTHTILSSNRQLGAPFPRWQSRIWRTTFTSGRPTARLLKRPQFTAISRAVENDVDMITGPTLVVLRNARYEANFHNRFNAAGAEVRNLKRGPSTRRFSSRRPHHSLPTTWRAFGDKDLYAYKGKRRLNPGQGEWAVAAVEDSIRSLFEGYNAVRRGGDPAKLSMAPGLFDALASLPIEMRNICVDNKRKPRRCFAPDRRNGKPRSFRYVSYAPMVLRLLKLKQLPKRTRLLPKCTGRSAIDGPSSSRLPPREGCEKAWDRGRPSGSERLQAAAGR